MLCWHAGAKNACTRQEILTLYQVEKLSEKSSEQLVFATKAVHFDISFMLLQWKIFCQDISLASCGRLVNFVSVQVFLASALLGTVRL